MLAVQKFPAIMTSQLADSLASSLLPPKKDCTSWKIVSGTISLLGFGSVVSAAELCLFLKQREYLS